MRLLTWNLNARREVRCYGKRAPGTSDHQGSVRLVKARPLSAAGVSPPVQIITPSFSWSITLFSLQALRNLTPAALVALSTRRRTAAI